jgi:hypothetical protein
MPVGTTNGHGWHAENHCLIHAGRLFVCISSDVYHSYILQKLHRDKSQYMIINEDFNNTGRKHYEITVVIIIVLFFQLSA